MHKKIENWSTGLPKNIGSYLIMFKRVVNVVVVFEDNGHLYYRNYRENNRCALPVSINCEWPVSLYHYHVSEDILSYEGLLRLAMESPTSFK